jgi:voltage-gated sodium channel
MHFLIGSLIIISMICTGLETSGAMMDQYGASLELINTVILGVFTVEISARILGHGLNFFKDPWHVFDFIIVGAALISFGGFIQIFRVLRIFWLLRFISIVPQFQHLIDSIIRSIPSLLAVVFFLFITIYVFAVIGTLEYSVSNPHLFGDLQTSMATIVQSMLMEHTWSERLEELSEHHKYAWAYIVPMIILINYLLLHLVLGVIISALHRQFEYEQESRKKSLLFRFFETKSTNHKELDLTPETQLLLHEIQKLKEELLKKKQS